MEKIFKVDRAVLIFAFRYALGRQSTAPNIVIDNIKKNIKEISNPDIEYFIKEINSCTHYGMEIDKYSWFELRDFLDRELIRRK